tara:strand:- start:11609 stop:12460 length:852 start_codon:yes stop_codon:yes gene_type:complete
MSELQETPDLGINKEIQIHSLADVSSKAEIGSGVTIGSGTVIGPDVQIGANTIVGANVVLQGRLKIGCNNKIFPGACLGLEPQDLKYKGAATEVVIGDRNTIREFVTINRATNYGEQTKVGDNNLLMAYCHIAHNCDVGNGVVMSNSVQVAGHVLIEDNAVIGGCAAIHQFVYIGSLSMIGGMTKVERDVPPFCLVEGNPGRVRSLNIVGIRRSGMERRNNKEFKQLQDIWKLLYRSEYVLEEGIRRARENPLEPSPEHLCNFLEDSFQQSRRGPIPIETRKK